MFRRQPPPPAKAPGPARDPDSAQVRLEALGYLLDQGGYTTRGLCILEVDGGFLVNGLNISERGAVPDLEQAAENIGPDEIARTIAHLNTGQP